MEIDKVKLSQEYCEKNKGWIDASAYRAYSDGLEYAEELYKKQLEEKDELRKTHEELIKNLNLELENRGKEILKNIDYINELQEELQEAKELLNEVIKTDITSPSIDNEIFEFLNKK